MPAHAADDFEVLNKRPEPYWYALICFIFTSKSVYIWISKSLIFTTSTRISP